MAPRTDNAARSNPTDVQPSGGSFSGGASAAPEAHNLSTSAKPLGGFHPPVSRLHAKLYTFRPGEVATIGRHRAHTNYKDRVQVGSSPAMSLPGMRDELYLLGKMSSHPGKLTETVVVADSTGLHPPGEAVMPLHIPRPACRPAEDHLQVEPSGLSATIKPVPGGLATFPRGAGGFSHLVAASATVARDKGVLSTIHMAPSDHCGKVDHVLPRQQGGHEAISHTGKEVEPPQHDQKKFEAGRNHNTQMYSGHLGKYETGLGIRVSQDDMPGPITHAGKMAQESEPASGKNYGAKAHAGQMVKESLGGFAQWLTAPFPMRGIKASGQTAVSNLKNHAHGMEAPASGTRRLLHAPSLLWTSPRSSPQPLGAQSPASRSPKGGQQSSSPTRAGSPASSKVSPLASPARPFLKAPWADWE